MPDSIFNDRLQNEWRQIENFRLRNPAADEY
jgi:hypothetical protein